MPRVLGRVVLVLAGFQMAVQLTGCSEDQYVCESTYVECGSVRVCCTEDDCYYSYGGREYPCDGTDCDEAALDLLDDMCASGPAALKTSTKASQEALKQTARKLASRPANSRCPTCP